MSSVLPGRPSSMDACGDQGLSALARGPLPDGFARRTVVMAPGARHPYLAAEWNGALVLLDRGEIVVEGVAGTRWPFGPGATLWLAGLPVAALHNPGPVPAVLVAISRRPP
jgi:hypothetical protein